MQYTVSTTKFAEGYFSVIYPVEEDSDVKVTEAIRLADACVDHDPDMEWMAARKISGDAKVRGGLVAYAPEAVSPDPGEKCEEGEPKPIGEKFNVAFDAASFRVLIEKRRSYPPGEKAINQSEIRLARTAEGAGASARAAEAKLAERYARKVLHLDGGDLAEFIEGVLSERARAKDAEQDEKDREEAKHRADDKKASAQGALAAARPSP